MNLLTIDTNTVASLATHTWSFANGITTCTYYVLYLAESGHPSIPVPPSFPFLHFPHLLCLSIYLNPVKALTVQSVVIIGASMLYGMLGITAFVGIACVPLSTPLTWLVAKLIYRKFP